MGKRDYRMTEGRFDLKKFLDEKAEKYNRPLFTETDPVKYDFALFGLGIFEKF